MGIEDILTTCPDVIYCSKCKYYRTWDAGSGCVGQGCRAKVYRVYNHAYCWKKYLDPREKNKTNKCKDFELKWWRKILMKEGKR